MKRYTFFRDPSNGRPFRGKPGDKGQNDNNPKGAPRYVLEDVGNSSFIDDAGNVAWKGNVLSRRNDIAINAAIVFLDGDEEELNEHDSSALFWKIVGTISKKSPGKPISVTDFLREADPIVAAFFRQPSFDRIMVTSISLGNLPLKTIKVGDYRISPLTARLPKFPYPDVLTSGGHDSAFGDHLRATKYRHVAVTTKGRSANEALSRALTALNVLRGVWTLYGTAGSWRYYLGTPQAQRIGTFHAGPIYTLHYPDGKLTPDNMYWHDGPNPREQSLFEDSKLWQGIEKRRGLALRRLDRLPYKQDLISLLNRYVGALDQLDPNVAFLQMWGILERITNSIGKDYEKVIDRVLWVFAPEDRPSHREFLDALRFRRNQFVHSGNSTHEADQVAYLVKSYLDPHLLRLISNPFRVENLTEYAEYLALPFEKEKLQKRYRSAMKAMQFFKFTKPRPKRKDSQGK